MSAEQFSTTNIANTIATHLASKLIPAGYLVYWHARDAVQTPDGWYFEYSVNGATYRADGTFAARYAAAKGMVTLTDSVPADPRHILRPTTDGSIGPADTVTVPVVAVEVGGAMPLMQYEMGTDLKWRLRHLVLDGFVRTKEELWQLSDLVAVWFDVSTDLDVIDHDSGTQAVVGSVRVVHARLDRAEWMGEPVERRFQFLVNARLEYVA